MKRQERAARWVYRSYVIIGVVIATMVLTMISVHGQSMFTFRQGGTGQTSNDFPSDSQGPPSCHP